MITHYRVTHLASRKILFHLETADVPSASSCDTFANILMQADDVLQLAFWKILFCSIVYSLKI